MGTVYLGRDTGLDRPVAIKVLRPELATAAASERFLREARILASLDHPNVVTVHRAGETAGALSGQLRARKGSSWVCTATWGGRRQRGATREL